MTTDFKGIIVEELGVLQKKEYQERNAFKARAYGKVISELKAAPHPIRNMEDLKEIQGIGAKIREKIGEILATGALRAAQEIKADKTRTIHEELTNIYGIGPVKAKSLIANHKIASIGDLRDLVERNPKILNDKQKIGLRYYEDLLERIPRAEMKDHEKLVAGATRNEFHMEVVGSYRRGKPDSGDIDVLLCPKDGKEGDIEGVVNQLVERGYILEILALGPKKCMAIAKIAEKARRLDLLVTSPEEFPYALLYFTGSDKFNIKTRKRALEKGYTMNEHSMKPIKEGVSAPPVFKDEADILSFLDIPYVKPEDR